MQIFPARTISQLVFIAFLVVLLPFLGALVFEARAIQHLVMQHQIDLEGVAQGTEAVEKLAKTFRDVERLGRQYQLLADPVLLEAIDAELTRALPLFGQLEVYFAREEAQAVHRDMRLMLEELQELLSSVPKKKAGLSSVWQLLKRLEDSLQILRQLPDQALQRMVAQSRAKGEVAQRSLILLGITVIPLTLLLMVWFSNLITRPIKCIDENIRQMGAGTFQVQPVRGPRDLQLIAKRLEWLGQKLQTSEAAKERFLRHISHELKTPLATIKEGVELLADGIPGPLSERQREVLAILQAGQQHLQVLINNLLDFNLLRRSKSLQRESLDLAELASSILRLYQLSAQRRNLRIRTHGKPVTLRADRAVLSAALDNLISNAIHYSYEGGTVDISWDVADVDVVIRVQDEGPGISLEEREKIFLPFYQGKASRTGPIKGTGLGLSIARECAELHHGELLIRDQPRGACLEMHLPRAVLLEG